jgi:transporter family-2 protein
MYYGIALLTGILVSVMVAFNGGLSEHYGIYSASVFIHLTGLLFIAAFMLAKREFPFGKRFGRQKWYLYMGGIIGVMTIVFTNIAFGRISVSAILALGLFGQSVLGMVIDRYGWLGMPRHPFRKRQFLGLLLMFCGIIFMIDKVETLAIAVTLMTGVTVIISRTLNARLAALTSVRTSTLFNYIFGLGVSVPLFLLLGRGEAVVTDFSFAPNIWLYLGGVTGAVIIILSNMSVAKVSALHLSVLLFIGQVFSGVAVDIVLSGEFSLRNVIGGAFVTAGLCLNLILERFKARR